MELSKIEQYHKNRLEYIQREISNRNKDKSIFIGLLFAMTTFVFSTDRIISIKKIFYDITLKYNDFNPDSLLLSILIYVFYIYFIYQLAITLNTIKAHENELKKYIKIVNIKIDILIKIITSIILMSVIGLSIYLSEIDYGKNYNKVKTLENIDKIGEFLSKDYKFCDYDNAINLFESESKDKRERVKLIQLNNKIYKCIRILKKGEKNEKYNSLGLLLNDKYIYKTFLIENGKEFDLNFHKYK
jgi:hypothetical protein